MHKVFYLIPILALTACQTTGEVTGKSAGKHVKASWYGVGDGSSSRTASGEKFNPYGHSAAHRHLPFGTKLLITNPKNSKSVVVAVNDRGPAHWTGAEIDLTKGAANAINMSGNQTVIMERLDKK